MTMQAVTADLSATSGRRPARTAARASMLRRGVYRHLLRALALGASAAVLLVLPPVTGAGAAAIGVAAIVLPMIVGFALGLATLVELVQMATLVRVARAERRPLTEADRRAATEDPYRVGLVEPPTWASADEAAWFAAADGLVL